jgi:hypothetical protein
MSLKFHRGLRRQPKARTGKLHLPLQFAMSKKMKAEDLPMVVWVARKTSRMRKSRIV